MCQFVQSWHVHEGIESGLSLPKLILYLAPDDFVISNIPFSWSLSIMLLAVSFWLLAILSRQCKRMFNSELLCRYLYWRQHGTQNRDRHAPISATWMDTIKVEFGNNHAFPWVLSTCAKPRESPCGPTQNTRYEAFVSMVTCLHCYWLLIGMWTKVSHIIKFIAHHVGTCDVESHVVDNRCWTHGWSFHTFECLRCRTDSS